MHALPTVTITDADRERLVALAKKALASRYHGRGASMLLSEIARASVVKPESLPPHVIDMGSEVDVRDNIRQTTERLRIVYPGREGAGEHEVSALTPVGAALIGLSEGDTIDWCTPGRDRRSLTVLRVHHHRGRSEEEPVPPKPA